MKILDDKISQLQKILVKDNKCVVGLKIFHGYKGIGGSNNSGFPMRNRRTNEGVHD